jgi:hypothetical protein
MFVHIRNKTKSLKPFALTTMAEYPENRFARLVNVLVKGLKKPKKEHVIGRLKVAQFLQILN